MLSCVYSVVQSSHKYTHVFVDIFRVNVQKMAASSPSPLILILSILTARVKTLRIPFHTLSSPFSALKPGRVNLVNLAIKRKLAV